MAKADADPESGAGRRSLRARLPLGILRTEPQFGRVWTASTVSVMGSAVTSLALPLTAVVTLHATAFQVAALEAVQWVPWLLIGLSAGVWVDRLKRRSVLIAGAAVSGVLLAAIPVADALGILDLGLLLVVAAGVGTASVFINSASPALVPALVDADHLIEANSLMRMSQSLAAATGPGLGGALVALFTAPLAIVFDCASYLISLVILAVTRIKEPGRSGQEQQKPHFKQIGEGLKTLFGNRYLRPMLAVTGVGNFANGMWNATFVLYFIRDLHIPAGYLGLPLVAFGIVSMTAAIAAPMAIRRFGVGRSMISGSIAGHLPWLLIPFLSPGWAAIVLLILPFAVAGLFSPVFNATLQSVMQVSVPNDMLGRIGSAMTMLSWGLMPVGALIGGALAAHDGYRVPLFAAAMLWNLSSVGFVGSKLWSLHKLPSSGRSQEPDSMAMQTSVKQAAASGRDAQSPETA